MWFLSTLNFAAKTAAVLFGTVHAEQISRDTGVPAPLLITSGFVLGQAAFAAGNRVEEALKERFFRKRPANSNDEEEREPNSKRSKREANDDDERSSSIDEQEEEVAKSADESSSSGDDDEGDEDDINQQEAETSRRDDNGGMTTYTSWAGDDFENDDAESVLTRMSVEESDEDIKELETQGVPAMVSTQRDDEDTPGSPSLLNLSPNTRLFNLSLGPGRFSTVTSTPDPSSIKPTTSAFEDLVNKLMRQAIRKYDHKEDCDGVFCGYGVKCNEAKKILKHCLTCEGKVSASTGTSETSPSKDRICRDCALADGFLWAHAKQCKVSACLVPLCKERRDRAGFSRQGDEVQTQ